MEPRNPYYVLEVAADASPGEIERQGRKLLGLIEVGSAKASTYRTPFGTFTRDETMVREAMAQLRDPARRAKESFLAGLLALDGGEDESIPTHLDAPLADAFLIGGYRGLG
jgi:hypothetical protein